MRIPLFYLLACQPALLESDQWADWKCGEFNSNWNECICGNRTITYEEYHDQGIWCCPSDKCHQVGKKVFCPNATIHSYYKPCKGECRNSELEYPCYTKNGHSLCFGRDRKNDGVYNCLSREDETFEGVKAENVPYDKLTICIEKGEWQGLTCNSDKECIHNDIWCQKWRANTCGIEGVNISTLNPSLYVVIIHFGDTKHAMGFGRMA